MTNGTDRVLPRDMQLPLFDPHVATFTCVAESASVPPIDGEANAWFLEARALESPEIFHEDRDYPRIVALTRRAAERRHWKAMLNLASLYIEGRDPAHGVNDALLLVEEAIRLGIPAAYDRMGTYFMNGTGVSADATKAYAFWQKAAQMGSPQAMAFLGRKLVGVVDKPSEGIWANARIARQMLQCALGQGYGDAAYYLSWEYLLGNGPITRDIKEKAFHTLHEGVRFGCQNCANKLQIEFDDPDSLATMITPFIDKARAKRYRVLGDALRFNPDLRFPNLDKILPLPPATIPTWNGDEDTLIEAAMGAKLLRPPATPAPAAQATGRQALNPAFRLIRSGEKTQQGKAPFAGYWQPTAPSANDDVRLALKSFRPGVYASGEAFEIPYLGPKLGQPARSQLVWEHWLTVDNDEQITPTGVSGLARGVHCPRPLQSSAGDKPCHTTGIWQPWVDRNHPLQEIVNVNWRQAWLTEGTPFPQPQRDWLIDIPAGLITWYLLDEQGVDINADLPVQPAEENS